MGSCSAKCGTTSSSPEFDHIFPSREDKAMQKHGALKFVIPLPTQQNIEIDVVISRICQQLRIVKSEEKQIGKIDIKLNCGLHSVCFKDFRLISSCANFQMLKIFDFTIEKRCNSVHIGAFESVIQTSPNLEELRLSFYPSIFEKTNPDECKSYGNLFQSLSKCNSLQILEVEAKQEQGYELLDNSTLYLIQQKLIDNIKVLRNLKKFYWKVKFPGFAQYFTEKLFFACSKSDFAEYQLKSWNRLFNGLTSLPALEEVILKIDKIQFSKRCDSFIDNFRNDWGGIKKIQLDCEIPSLNQMLSQKSMNEELDEFVNQRTEKIDEELSKELELVLISFKSIYTYDSFADDVAKAISDFDRSKHCRLESLHL